MKARRATAPTDEYVGEEKTVSDSVRPFEEEKERRWIEQVRRVDEVMGFKCYVCGVNGEVEEMSDEDEVTKVDPEGKDGEKVEKIKAEKDERDIKEILDPRRPTQKEVEDHERAHLPYRNWCSICVRAKVQDADHRKCVKEERGLSEYSFGYVVIVSQVMRSVAS